MRGDETNEEKSALKEIIEVREFFLCGKVSSYSPSRVLYEKKKFFPKEKFQRKQRRGRNDFIQFTSNRHA